MDPAGLDVGEAFGELGIDDAVLLWRVFVVRGRELRTDADDAAHDHEFDLLAALEAGLPAYGGRDHKRCLIFDGNGHDRQYAQNVLRFRV